MRRLALLLTLLGLACTATAAPTFPALSGRVVDAAGLLSPAVEQQLTERLAGHEQASGNQLVVVTVGDLQGYPIEDYGYQLGRHWGIGEAGKNTGVLLLVAPKERAVRIEVGYGLEGELTDAISHDIIQNRILPALRSGDYETGITAGAEAIIQALGGEYAPAPAPRRSEGGTDLGWVFFIALGVGELLRIFSRRRWLTGFGASLVGLVIASLFTALGTGLFVAVAVYFLHLLLGARGGHYGGGGGFGGGGFRSGGGGFGGFSGGGGSFGGGGASGRW